MLLAIAFLLAIFSYFGGIDVASIKGTISGLEVNVSGPFTMFLVTILIFKLVGLFRQEPESSDLLSEAKENLTLNDVDAILGNIQGTLDQLNRRQRELRDYKKALEGGATTEGAFIASGFQPAGRPLERLDFE